MITSKIVPENERLNFLPLIAKDYMKFEAGVYHYADVHIDNYEGSYWEFVELSNGGKFLYPTDDAPLHVTNCLNYFEGQLSPEATGICIVLLLLSDLCGMWYHKNSAVSERYGNLYLKLNDYAQEHNEASNIRSFLD